MTNGEVLTYENGVWKNKSSVKKYYASITGSIQSGFTVGGVYDITQTNTGNVTTQVSISTLVSQIQSGFDVRIMSTVVPNGGGPFYGCWLYPVKIQTSSLSEICFYGFS